MFASFRHIALTRARDALSSLVCKVLLRAKPKWVNACYNHLPHRWRVFLVSHGVFSSPKHPFPWRLRLNNNKFLCFQVNPADSFSVSLAFDYAIHDCGLKRVQEFLIDRSSPESLYIDIGANIGVSSIYALSAGKRCWLFEPNHQLHTFGQDIFSANGFTGARWEPVALSEHAGQANFFLSRSSFLSSFDRHHAAQEGDVVQVVVPIRTLDSYLTELQSLTTELIIKIDVEGHEISVLKGAFQVITRFQPPVMIELLPEATRRRQVWDYFHTLDYSCFAIHDQDKLKLTPLATPAELNAAPWINFLFLPAQHRLHDSPLAN